jgi:hypothetical protein
MASRKKDTSSMGVGEGTSLATKLQQAWLQSQLPKVPRNRNPSSSSSIFSGTETSKAPNQTNPHPAASTTSKPAFSSPTPKGLVPPTLRSYSIKESNICNDQGSSSPSSDGSSTSRTQGRVGELAESESLTTFIDDMLMEEDMDNTWFMDQESNAYQAMEKSFADLIDEVPVLPPLHTESNMFENNEKGVVATTDEYNKKSSSNDSLDFTRLSEEVLEDRVLNEVTDLLSQQLGQMCLSLESTTSNNKIYMTNTAYYLDPLHTARVTTISNNRPHETTATMSAASMHHLGKSTGGGLQHDLKFAFKTGPEDELVDLLIRCAEAIGQNDVTTASQLVVELRECSSPYGSGAQRMAHYFTDALVRSR